MAASERLICAAGALVNGGPGVRFTAAHDGAPSAAFVVRHGGRAYAYLNRCAHVPTELDWMAGEFFDRSGLYLICATHGALYEPASGHCIAGPCAGQSLVALAVVERDGAIYLQEDDDDRSRTR